MSGEKLDRDRAALIVVDVQEGFRKAIPDLDRVVAAIATLAAGAEATGVPVIVTEQYPRGLGSTVAELASALPAGVEPVEKLCFSAARAEGFSLGDRDQAIVCGIEAHVCVNQTVLDLVGEGIDVHVVADAVASRSEADRDLGLRRAERAGATVTGVEMALFELVGAAGGEAFKQVQRLILEYAPNA